MKPIFILVMLLCVVGCERKLTITQIESSTQPIKPSQLPSLSDDFVMGSSTAVSNALYFKQPPMGWSVACDNRGRYAPMHGTFVVENSVDTVRTNEFEAMVACWRTKEIWDDFDARSDAEMKSLQPPNPAPVVWQDCNN